MWVWIWLAVVVLSLVIEFITFEFVTIWFSVGGLVALILAACGVGPAIHISVFSAISIVCLLGFRNLALKYLLKNKENTNTDLIINKAYKLLTPIKSDSMGTIKVNDITWNVTTQDGSEIEEGARVITIEIQGNKMIVKREEAKAVVNDQPVVEEKKVAPKAPKSTPAVTKKVSSSKTSTKATSATKQTPKKTTNTTKQAPKQTSTVKKTTSTKTKGDK